MENKKMDNSSIFAMREETIFKEQEPLKPARKKRSSVDEIIEFQKQCYETEQDFAKMKEEQELFVKGVCQNIDRERDRHGLSQQGLAELSGISISHIHRLVNGESGLGVSALYRIAFALQISPADLLPSTTSTKQTNGQIYDEITKELDVQTNNTLLKFCAEWVKEVRRITRNGK